MRSVARLFAPVVFLVILCARAQAGPVEEAAHKAREAFAEGSAQFNLGNWEKAVDAWQNGYRQKPDPIFLYNIAQAYRLWENHEERAIFFYKSYLRNSPKAANRDEVQEKVD